jgi:hypothetical protein
MRKTSNPSSYADGGYHHTVMYGVTTFFGSWRVRRMTTVFESILYLLHSCQNTDVPHRLLFLREGRDSAHIVFIMPIVCTALPSSCFNICNAHNLYSRWNLTFSDQERDRKSFYALVFSKTAAHPRPPRTPIWRRSAPWPTTNVISGVGWAVRSWSDRGTIHEHFTSCSQAHTRLLLIAAPCMPCSSILLY